MSDPEFEKLVTLARSARGRIGASEGAAVRDELGRTYNAASVAIGSLALSAVQLTVSTAASSGSRGLEAVVLVSDASQVTQDDLAAVRDFAGAGIPLALCNARGEVVAEIRS